MSTSSGLIQARLGDSWVRIRVAAVLFDFYNTLVLLDEDKPDMHETLTALGYPCNGRIERLFNSEGYNGLVTPSGATYPSWRYDRILSLCTFVGVPSESAPRITEELLSIDQQWTVTARKGAVETIRALRERGIAVGICSNWDYDLERYLDQAGLPRSLPSLTSAQAGARKPHPHILREACRHLGVGPEKTLYVGDNWETDVVGAVRAGLMPCWLTDLDVTAQRSVLTISSIDDLVQNEFAVQ